MKFIDYLYDNFKMYNPTLSKHVKEYFEISDRELIVKTETGECYLYNDMENTIASLPSDCNDLSEQQLMRQFRLRLNNKMKEQFLNQNDLSELTGLSQATISNYCSGRTSPSYYALVKIARALNCSIEDFTYKY